MITIVIPTLNEEKCIETCMRSLRSQNYSGKYEIILVDGYSSDKTVEIAKRYADKILFRKAHGPAAGRNDGAKAAHYPIVAFIDADCIARKDWLARIEKDFQDEKLLGVGGVLAPDPKEGNVIDAIMFKLNADWWVRFSARLGLYQLYGNNCAYRRNAFLKIGGFSEKVSFFEDTELSMRMKRKGKLKIDGGLVVSTSVRRFRQQGYLKVAFQNIRAFMNALRGRQITERYFDVIKR